MDYRYFLSWIGGFTEERFPLRKLLASSFRVPLVLYLAALFTSVASASELETALQDQARQTLIGYARQRGWEIADAAYSVWLPESAARLPRCSQPLKIAPAKADAAPWGRVAYTVGCGGGKSWSVRGRVDVQLWLLVWSARADLPSHRELSADDIVPRRMEVSRLRHFSVQQENVIGLRTQRRVRAGQLLAAAELAPRLAVHKGEEVLIKAARGDFSASARGEALEQGGIGDAIKVRNKASNLEIQAWITEPGVVETRF